MELKSMDREALIDAVKRAADSGHASIDRTLEAVIKDIEVAARGLQALEHGAGSIIERAQHVFVTEFRWDAMWLDREAVCDPRLQFNEAGYTFDLSSANWLNSREKAPKMRNETRYRAILILEPLE